MDYIQQIDILKGGVPKLPVRSAYISQKGLVGDKHKTKKYHGGLDSEVCLFLMDVIKKLQKEGHSILPGSTRENLTIRHHNYFLLKEGIKLQIGENVLIEVVSYTVPCETIRALFLKVDFSIILQELNPGNSRLYATGLQEKWIKKVRFNSRN